VFFNRASKEASVQNGLKWPAQKKKKCLSPHISHGGDDGISMIKGQP